ncbi:MAG: class I SAM-dependent methyltransferase [Elusimicrobia bacterium]|nr:class I SAM-dependent methyltransferase [Elusimicrobiota bacterium]
MENTCPVCGELKARDHASVLKRCGACGLYFRTERVFISPVYAPGLEDGIYGSAKKELFAEALNSMESMLNGKGRLLDIGCAGGEFLKAAAGRGWRAEGVELDTALAVKALARGFEVHTRPVEEAGLAGGAYDAVTVFEVFSQMEKPAAAAAELLRLLVPGGVIHIREFNAAFHLPLYRLEKAGLFRPLGISPSIIHNLNFRARTLRFMLEKAGFGDIRVRNSPPTAGDPYRTGGALGGFLTGALKVLYYWLAQALWFITLGRVFAGSTLIVTAGKRPSDGHSS